MDKTFIEIDNEETIMDLQTAISAGEVLRIRYSGGASPGGIREIVPKALQLPDLVSCLCLNDNKVKSFKIERIEIIKSPEQEQEWERKFEILRMSMIKNVKLKIRYKKFTNSEEVSIYAHPFSFSDGCTRFDFRANDRKSISSIMIRKIKFEEDYDSLKYEAHTDSLDGWFNSFLVSQRCPQFSFHLSNGEIEVILREEKVAHLFKRKNDFILNAVFTDEIFSSPREAVWYLLKNLYRAKVDSRSKPLEDVENF